MKIITLEETPFHEIMFLNARPRGGVEAQRLPFLRGRVDKLPDGIDGLVATSDLQGVSQVWSRGGESMLLGIAVVETLQNLAMEEIVPEPYKCVALLAGDFYSVPEANKRGASGDVTEVWYSFASSFRWVAGVAGNHDQFGSDASKRRLEACNGVYLLDGTTATLDSLCVSGVGKIIGKPTKPGRRSAEEFIDVLNLCIDRNPDLLVTHQGPQGGTGQRGDPVIRETIELGGIPLTICGHCHWKEPIADIGNSGELQVLNVDSRVVVLESSANPSSS